MFSHVMACHVIIISHTCIMDHGISVLFGPYTRTCINVHHSLIKKTCRPTIRNFHKFLLQVSWFKLQILISIVVTVLLVRFVVLKTWYWRRASCAKQRAGPTSAAVSVNVWTHLAGGNRWVWRLTEKTRHWHIDPSLHGVARPHHLYDLTEYSWH